VTLFNDDKSDVVSLGHALGEFPDGVQEPLLHHVTSRGSLPLNDFHTGHLEIEQNQAVTILAVKFADLVRIGSGMNECIPGDAQHSLDQPGVGFLVVDDQDLGVQNVR
jgi:hypothetical protein